MRILYLCARLAARCFGVAWEVTYDRLTPIWQPSKVISSLFSFRVDSRLGSVADWILFAEIGLVVILRDLRRDGCARVQ